MTDHKEYTPEDFDDPSDFIAWFENPEVFTPQNIYQTKIVETAMGRLLMQINNTLRLSETMPFSAIMNYDYENELKSFINENYNEIVILTPVPKNVSRLSISEIESALKKLIKYEVVERQQSLQSMRNERIKLWTSNLFEIPKDACWRDYIKTLDSRSLLEKMLSLQPEYDKKLNKYLELTIEDYIKGWEYELERIKQERKDKIGWLLYSEYSVYVKSVLDRNKEVLYDTDEWKKMTATLDYESIPILSEIIVSASFSIPVKYWAEHTLYKEINGDGYFSKDCGEIFDKIISPFLQNRSPDTINIESKIDFDMQDYMKWCGLYWENTLNEKLADQDKKATEESYNYQRTQPYNDNEALTHSDGYAGYLDDDYIHDALGGDPDAYNID